jgi:hypothetical protein
MTAPIDEAAFALGQLRHLYAQMLVEGRVLDTAEAARGLLGPAIETLERRLTELEAALAVARAPVPPGA